MADMTNTNSDRGEITVLLQKAQHGDVAAVDRLFRHLLGGLRQAADRLLQQERIDHTLQPTALINEACVRLLDQNVVQVAQGRRYLFAAAHRAMRQVLVDHARRRDAAKREGQWRKTSLDVILDRVESQSGCDFAELNAALLMLEQDSPRQREVVEHRFFGGLSVEATAELLSVSIGTVERDWRLARTKLYAALRDDH